MGKVYRWRDVISDYWSLLHGKRSRFLFFTILKALTGLIPFAIAYGLGQIVDFFTSYSVGDALNFFYVWAGAITFLGAFQVVFRFYTKIRMQTIAADIRKEVRVKAMSKLMHLSLSWHEKEDAGSKIHKINEGGEKIFEGIRSFSNEGLTILVGLIGSLGVFIFLDWRYALYSILFSAIYLSGEVYYNRKLSYQQDRLNKIREKVSGKIHESTSNLLTVKSMGLKNIFKNKTKQYEEQYYKIWKKTRDVSQSKSKTIKSFAAAAYGGFIFFLGLDVVSGTITVGSIVVYAAYFDKLKWALDNLTNKMKSFIETKSGIGRFMTIFRQEVVVQKGARISKKWKTINFENISFKYKNQNVLDIFNLQLNRGEKIGIVGKSGCGKSTLVKILLGLYNPSKGIISIDDKNLQEFSHDSITKEFSIVLQESEMFNLTLLENVTISSRKKDINKFKLAAKVAHLHNVIAKLPLGLNTLIGEKGYQLSGGERQRVGLARAIYKDSSLLILDEATSALDSKTEKHIQTELDKEKRTMIIIAHRLSTLKNVDRILFMHKGKVAEMGSYSELIKKKGHFYKMNLLQKQR